MAVSAVIGAVLTPGILAGKIDPYSPDFIRLLIYAIAAISFAGFAFRIAPVFVGIAKDIKKMILSMRKHKVGGFYWDVDPVYHKMIARRGWTPETERKARQIYGWSLLPIAAVTIWCGYYFAVTSNLTALIGVIVGAIGFAVTGWQARMLKDQVYTPFFAFLRRFGTRTPLFVLFLALALTFAVSTPDTAFAAQMEMPSSFEVQKKDDISAQIFDHIFGEGWQETAGKGTGGLISAEQIGAFSELVLDILAVLNTCAMLFVGMAVIYLTACFALVTAHEGKSLGGSMFNSLWVPVRFTLAMSFTAPVLKGLSLLQVMLLFCIGGSINLANTVWDVAGAHVVEKAQTKLIQGVPTYIDAEAKSLVAPLLKSATIQEVMRAYSNGYPRENPEDPYFVAKKGNGQYVYHMSDGGTHRILFGAPNGYQQDEIGGVAFKYPVKKDNNESIAVFKAKLAIADARGEAIIQLAEDVRAHACHYLVENHMGATDMKEIKMNGRVISSAYKRPAYRECPPKKDVAQIIADYSERVRQATSENASGIIDHADVKSMLAKAIDHDGKTSKFGWISAGTFSFTLSQLQKRYDDVLSGGGVSYTFAKDSAFHDTDRSGWFNNKNKYVIPDWTVTAIENVDEYSTGLFNDSYYIKKADYSDKGTVTGSLKSIVSKVSDAIMEFFNFNPLTHASSENRGGAEGVTATVLYKFRNYDPFVVMQEMGDKLIDLGLIVAGLDAGIGLIGINLSIMSVASSALIIVGLLFSYVIVFMPIIFWLRAIISWIFLVVESMVAAPLWAASHCLPEGNGLAGSHARRGYIMAFDIILRPTLLTIGAVFAIVVVQASGWLYGTVISAFLVNIGSFVQFSPVTDLIFGILITSVMFYLSYTIYTKGINHMPSKVIAWIGGQGMSMGEEQETHQTTAIVGGVINQSGGAAGQGMKAAAGGVKNAGKGIINLGRGAANRIFKSKPGTGEQ